MNTCLYSITRPDYWDISCIYQSDHILPVTNHRDVEFTEFPCPCIPRGLSKWIGHRSLTTCLSLCWIQFTPISTTSCNIKPNIKLWHRSPLHSLVSKTIPTCKDGEKWCPASCRVIPFPHKINKSEAFKPASSFNTQSSSLNIVNGINDLNYKYSHIFSH